MTGELEILSSVRNCQRFSLCKTKNLRPHLGHKSPLVGKKSHLISRQKAFVPEMSGSEGQSRTDTGSPPQVLSSV